MSATKFITPLRVQADQKEVIIAHLKEQIYHLKKNQQEFYTLEDQYRKLEKKYVLLGEEKAHGDADFRSRHEAALRTLNVLKAQLDDLKAQLKDKNIQISDLQADENTLRNLVDQRNIDVDKLKAQLNSLLGKSNINSADADELLNARNNLIQTAQRTRQTNATLADKLSNLDNDKDNINRKIQQTQKYLEQLLTQEKILKDKIIAYQNQNNNLDSDINATIDDLNILNSKINQAQNQIKNLQAAIAETQALANKFKSQANHYQKCAQAEALKNNDISKLIHQAENTFRLRVNQVQQGRKEISSLAAQNQALNRQNRLSQDDIEFCRKHLQNLAMINTQIVKNLQIFNEQDQQVRRLLDRRGIVIKMKNRLQQTSVILNRTTITTNNFANRSPLQAYR